MKANLACMLALLSLLLAAAAAADAITYSGRKLKGGCSDMCRGRTQGPVPRRICPGKTASVYGNKKTYPCGWQSSIRNLGTLGGNTRITYLSTYGNAPGSAFGLTLPAGVDMIPILDEFSNIDNQCVVWIRHDAACY
ncbi:hypothetical protein COHA_005122 [Chlorella ohadii]|uniref:Uncharacterized protein n=1 Tax=Chlorella ohadii TaxID=2649997 RepID=A0AAD5DRW7_9CHLO|nr:hypothetical protein COHA_005122 [Chlorella ohadii]